jgi:hypothetical protein
MPVLAPRSASVTSTHVSTSRMWLGISHEHDPPCRCCDQDLNWYGPVERNDPAATLSTRTTEPFLEPHSLIFPGVDSTCANSTTDRPEVTMATGRPSKQRRDREKAKKAKAAEKRLRRQNRDDNDDQDSSTREPVDEQDVIRQLADLNASYEGGDLEFEDFDLQRAALLDSLTIE